MSISELGIGIGETGYNQSYICNTLKKSINMRKYEYYDPDCSSYNGKSKWLKDNGDDSGDCDMSCSGCAYFYDCHG